MSEVNPQFSQIKERLDEIVQTVSDEDISLDDALSLYEEAVGLGMQVSSVLEEDIAEEEIVSEVEAVQPAEGVTSEISDVVETPQAEESDQGSQAEEENHG